jgi:hypothetical protein
MPLHILFCDEMLLYFILRIGVVEIQIWFEFNLQIWKKKLKNFPIHYTGHGPKPQVFLQTGPVGLLLHSPLWPGLVAWPGAQWPAWAHAGLIFLVETWPRRILSSPTKNPPNPNRNPIQTSIGDSVGVIFLLRRIREQNPYK